MAATEHANHCIRVVSASEATGQGWLRLSEWMREWAGRSELHLVHIEQLDLVGLQSLLARIEYALSRQAEAITIDIGIAQITPAAMLSLIAERRHLEELGVKLVLRGRANLRGSASAEIDELPARALVDDQADEKLARRRPPMASSIDLQTPATVAPAINTRPRHYVVHNRRVTVSPS